MADGRTANITGQPEVTMSPTEETEETVSPRGGSGGSANGVAAPPPPLTPVSAAGTPRFNANERKIVATVVNPSDTPRNLQAMGAAPGKGVGAR